MRLYLLAAVQARHDVHKPCAAPTGSAAARGQSAHDTFLQGLHQNRRCAPREGTAGKKCEGVEIVAVPRLCLVVVSGLLSRRDQES